MTTYAEIFKNLIVELDGMNILNLCPHDAKYEAKDRSFSILFPTVGKDAALRLPVKSTEEERSGLIFGKHKPFQSNFLRKWKGCITSCLHWCVQPIQKERTSLVQQPTLK